MIKPAFLLACFAATALSYVPVNAQAVDTLDPALKSRIDRIATQVLEQTGVPSASVAIVKGGKLVYAHGQTKIRPIKFRLVTSLVILSERSESKDLRLLLNLVNTASLKKP